MISMLRIAVSLVVVTSLSGCYRTSAVNVRGDSEPHGRAGRAQLERGNANIPDPKPALALLESDDGSSDPE
jgi:hypothetical protein